MAKYFIPGSTYIRPGTYFNRQKSGDNSVAGAVDGIVACLFRSRTGPLGSVVELDRSSGYKETFGDGLTTDAVREAFAGGASTVLAVRVGNGGTASSVSLKNTDNEEAVKIESVYPGDLVYSITVKPSLTDSAKKQLVIYQGQKELLKIEFEAGGDETGKLKAAMDGNKQFILSVVKENSEVASVNQTPFDKGALPEVTVNDYSNALDILESYYHNTICVDTEDMDVIQLVNTFEKRVFEDGIFGMFVCAEKNSVNLDSRIEHAAACNSEQCIYVLNAKAMIGSQLVEGYQVAARIAGMAAAVRSNQSLTHTVVNGYTELLEPLKNSDITRAEKNGCLVLSVSAAKQVWIDSAINTLVTLSGDLDEGWKKIRRAKARFELLQRVNAAMDDLVGRVDCDTNGLNTAIAKMQTVADTMIAESKISACEVGLNEEYPAESDSAWFMLDVIDRDSLEHIYLVYKFRYAASN